MFENDIRIDRKMDRQIASDWGEEFPNLVATKHDVFRRRVGPLLISLWHDLNGSRTDIRPHISYANLDKPCPSGMIGAALMFDTHVSHYKSKITSYGWKEHKAGLYKIIADEFRQHAIIPLEGPVKLSKIIEAYKKQKWPDCMGGYEDPALIAAYCGCIELAEEYVAWGISFYKERRIGNLRFSSIEEWEASLRARIQNPDALRRITEEQVVMHKLEKIPYEDIVVDM